MTVQTFCDLLAQRPFRPFRIARSDGAVFEVRHPSNAFLTRSALLVGIDVDDDGIPGDFRICQLAQIEMVEPIRPEGLD